MLEYFLFAFNAVMPMIALTLVGVWLRSRKIFSEDFFAQVNKLIFQCFFPIMVFHGIYGIESLPSVNWSAVAVCVAGMLLMFVMGYVLQRLFVRDPRQKGVIWQGTYRPNFAFVGLPMAESLGGAPALAFASVISAFVQLTVNVMSVIALTSVSTESINGWDHIKQVLKKLPRNPIIIASVSGLLLLVIRQVIPVNENGELAFSIQRDIPFLYTAMANAAKVASPLAMVSLGAQFVVPREKTDIRVLGLGVFARLIASPVMGLLLCWGVTVLGISHFGTAEYPAVLALYATPVGVASCVMVQNMGGDVKLANQLVMFTSIISIVTLIGFITFTKAAGLL